MTGERISTPADFRTVVVHRDDRPTGAVYTLTFPNQEFGGWRQDVTAIAAILAMIVLIPATILLGLGVVKIGIPWYVAPLLTIPGFAWLFIRTSLPWRHTRTIELDFGQDVLRVWRNEKVAIERQLSRLANVTVEDHPDAAFERQARIERGDKFLQDEEKMHCLVGWFGAEGAEQVILVTRAEWPDRRSLFEVRQAIIWTMKQASRPGGFRPADDDNDSKEAYTPPAGIKPPLD